MIAFNASLRRIVGLLIHFVYVYKNTPSFNINLFAWPAMNVLIWGFMNQYLSQQYGGTGVVAGSLIVGAVMWDVLMRSNWETVGFIYDDYSSRCVAQLWASPVRLHEYVIALLIGLFPPTLISLGMVTLFVYGLFDFEVWSLGWNLLLYIPLIALFGWATAILASLLIVRLGVGAANVVWFPVFIFASLSAIYYPVEALPPTLQKLAYLFPPTHLLEHIRADLAGAPLPLSDLWVPLALNVGWGAVACAALGWMLNAARKRGRLLNIN